jgi:Domain of unknown function (DUF4270)
MQLFSFSKYTLFSIALGGALALAGCTKPTSVGSDVIPGSDYINGTLVTSDANTADTAIFRMNTETILNDSVTTFNTSALYPIAYMSRLPFGKLTDPVFGTSTSGIYLVPRNDNTKFGSVTGQKVDSVVLVLQYDTPADALASTVQEHKTRNVIGDTTQIQTLKIFQTSDTLSRNTYFSNTPIGITNTPLATLSYLPKPYSPTIITSRNYKNTADSSFKTQPHLRIKMNDVGTGSIWQRLMDSPVALRGTASQLRDVFKGIYIEPGNTNTCLTRFNVNSAKVDNTLPSWFHGIPVSSNSGLIIYYHETVGADQTTKAYPLSFKLVNSISPEVLTMKFQHNRMGTPVANALLPGNLNRVGDSVIYVQGLAGTNGKITFPNLAKLKGKVIINKAELVFKTISDASNIPKPAYLALSHVRIKNRSIYKEILDLYDSQREPLTTYDYIPPAYSGSFGDYGGKLNGSTYTINITRDLQNMINQNLVENNTLYISNLGKAHRMQRVILGGARNRTYAPVLKVYMSYL